MWQYENVHVIQSALRDKLNDGYTHCLTGPLILEISTLVSDPNFRYVKQMTSCKLASYNKSFMLSICRLEKACLHNKLLTSMNDIGKAPKKAEFSILRFEIRGVLCSGRSDRI